jgi:diacylglycerol kinase family enzyme
VSEPDAASEGRHVDVLVNALAGSVDGLGGSEELERTIVDAFAAAGGRAVVHLVEPQDLVDELLACWGASPQPRAVVVAGGDGTVGGIAAAAAEHGVVLGVLPLGTFNHFAKDLGMPTDLAGAAAALVGGEVRRVDLAEVNGRAFVNNSVLGTYPEMVAVRDQVRERRGWGKVRAVPVAALAVARRFPLHRLDLEGPGYRRARVRTPLLFVGNGVYDNGVGGQPERGSLDDGLLGVAVARATTRLGFLRSVLRALVRGADAVGELETVELGELVVRIRSKRVRVAFDGEVDQLVPPLRYRVRPGVLQVLAPTVAAAPVGPAEG